MPDLSSMDLLGSAAEEVLAQLVAIPLFRQRVLAYIPIKAQKRIAGRIAKAVLCKVFRRLVLKLDMTDQDFAVELLPDKGIKFPSRAQHVRWCNHCKANRPAYYSELALRCMRCNRPTSPMRDDDDAAEPVGRSQTSSRRS